MEFKRDECTFSIPDSPTVKQQMLYFSAGAGLPIAMRHWEGAKVLIEKWDCSQFPDFKADLDSVTDPNITTILLWAGAQVVTHINGLDAVPKN